MKPILATFGLFLLFLSNAHGQNSSVQINRDNRTIAVTAEDSVEVPAEVAVVEIGYHNFAATKEAAYEENVRTADHILKAIDTLGIPESAVETETLSLKRVLDIPTRLPGRAPADDKTSDEHKPDQFEARQTWKARVSVAMAQRVVDAAVRIGANELDDTEWVVLDPAGLQAKAAAAALVKARTMAEQMAKGLNARLGVLVYASNKAPTQNYFSVYGQRMNTTDASITTAGEPSIPLSLFPQKVKMEATVYAVFAIE